MNPDLLIDSIVRQTTVLIAQLATATGGRAPLAHTANQVFTDLIRELKEQGIGSKVIADMFGLTLRTYHNRVRRLAESSTFKGRSLWEAVLSFVQERSTVRRADILRRFANDDERVLRAVLSDLVDSGVVFRSGRGDHTTYRAASSEEFSFSDADQKLEALGHLVAVTISRFGPLGRDEISPHVRAPVDVLEKTLAALVALGKVRLVDGLYSADRCVIPFEEPAGWEAAVFDHYQAMVTAICIKLRRGTLSATLGDSIGGSTYTFDLWEGHPMQHEVLGLLQTLRKEARGLRERVEAWNLEHAPLRDANAERELRVIAYVGQGVLGTETEERGDGEW
jgi:hypothetical protein